MNTIQPYLTNTHKQGDLNLYNHVNVQSTRISISQQQQKDITIFTEDGDRVTISSDQQSQLLYTNGTGFSQRIISGVFDDYAIAGKSVAEFQKEALEHKSNRYLSISVQGDLSEQELKDIRKVLKDIDQIMTDLLQGGDVEKGLAMAINLIDMESISGFTANYRYENAVQIEQVSVDDVSTYSDNGLLKHIKPVTDDDNDFIKNLIEEMFNIVKASGVESSKLINPLKRLFTCLREDLLENHPENQPKVDLTKFIEEKLIGKLKNIPKPKRHRPYSLL